MVPSDRQKNQRATYNVTLKIANIDKTLWKQKELKKKNLPINTWKTSPVIPDFRRDPLRRLLLSVI